MEAELDERLSEIRETFGFFDRDSNGLIDFDEFRALLRTVNPEATTSQRGVGRRTTPIITPWNTAPSRGSSGIQRSRDSGASFTIAAGSRPRR